jgi:anti-sigma regulatory factor (Ser/Thr protein kinase)
MILVPSRMEMQLVGVTSLRQARHAIQSMLGERAESEAGRSALLAASELMNNAVAYTGGGTVRATYDRRTDVIFVEVEDLSPVLPHVAKASDASQLTGRGLNIVNDVTTSWGMQRRGNGKVIWFCVE